METPKEEPRWLVELGEHQAELEAITTNKAVTVEGMTLLLLKWQCKISAMTLAQLRETHELLKVGGVTNTETKDQKEKSEELRAKIAGYKEQLKGKK